MYDRVFGSTMGMAVRLCMAVRSLDGMNTNSACARRVVPRYRPVRSEKEVRLRAAYVCLDFDLGALRLRRYFQWNFL